VSERLYEAPYTDLHPRGVEGLFAETEVGQLIDVLHEIRARASA
jgi:hypothetical protein